MGVRIESKLDKTNDKIVRATAELQTIIGREMSGQERDNTLELVRVAAKNYGDVWSSHGARRKYMPTSWPHTDAPFLLPKGHQENDVSYGMPLAYDLTNADITGGEQACIIGQADNPLQWYSVHLRAGQNGTKWLARIYEAFGDVMFCYMTDNEHTVEGHAFYANTVNGLTFYGCTFLNNSGNDIQLVRRPKEAPNALPASDVVRISRCWFDKPSIQSQRCSYSVAVYGTGQALEMLDNEACGLARGLLVCEPEPAGGNGGTWWEVSMNWGKPITPYLYVRGLEGLWSATPDREVIRLGSVLDTDIQGLVLESNGGTKKTPESYRIKIDDYAPEDTRPRSGRGRIGRVEADAPVRIMRGKEVIAFDARASETTWK